MQDVLGCSLQIWGFLSVFCRMLQDVLCRFGIFLGFFLECSVQDFQGVLCRFGVCFECSMQGVLSCSLQVWGFLECSVQGVLSCSLQFWGCCLEFFFFGISCAGCFGMLINVGPVPAGSSILPGAESPGGICVLSCPSWGCHLGLGHPCPSGTPKPQFGTGSHRPCTQPGALHSWILGPF